MESTALALTGRDALIAIGKLANEYADGNTFEDFNKRKSANTLTAYRGDLASFAAYVSEATGGAARLDAGELQTTPDAWTGVTWGLVSGFNAWLLKNGASIGTINRKLARGQGVRRAGRRRWRPGRQRGRPHCQPHQGLQRQGGWQC
jgi:hypothetical protein